MCNCFCNYLLSPIKKYLSFLIVCIKVRQALIHAKYYSTPTERSKHMDESSISFILN